MTPGAVSYESFRIFDAGLVAAERRHGLDVVPRVHAAVTRHPFHLAVVAFKHLDLDLERRSDVYVDLRLEPETAQRLHHVEIRHFRDRRMLGLDAGNARGKRRVLNQFERMIVIAAVVGVEMRNHHVGPSCRIASVSFNRMSRCSHTP